MLARTLAKARDEPLCVPHRRSPRRMASCTRGSWSRPRKLSEPKLTTRRPSTTISRPGPASSITRSFRCESGCSSPNCSMIRTSVFWRRASPSFSIGQSAVMTSPYDSLGKSGCSDLPADPGSIEVADAEPLVKSLRL